MNIQLRNIFRSLALAAGISLVAYIGLNSSLAAGEDSILRRPFILLGGKFSSGGYIQFFTYFAFFWSFFDILKLKQNLLIEANAFNYNLLPTNEKHLLLPQDVMDLQLRISQFEKEKSSGKLTDIIKKACLKFRSSKSIPEVIDVISIQVEINKEKSESSQSTIRYLTWVIPSIGFIGTVLGISKALAIANSAQLDDITATLGVAFDTTLVSLVLSIIAMYLFHNLQEKTDNFHANLREYVMSNLVNRIEV